jgi:hypothetical protein
MEVQRKLQEQLEVQYLQSSYHFKIVIKVIKPNIFTHFLILWPAGAETLAAQDRSPRELLAVSAKESPRNTSQLQLEFYGYGSCKRRALRAGLCGGHRRMPKLSVLSNYLCF